MARNHSTSGLWLSWKTVPAVTDVWWPHIAHSHNPRGWLHAFSPAHLGQRNPSGQRRAYRYFRHSSSEENRASNSGRLRGKSSTLKYYGWGLPESNGYPDLPAYPRRPEVAPGCGARHREWAFDLHGARRAPGAKPAFR